MEIVSGHLGGVRGQALVSRQLLWEELDFEPRRAAPLPPLRMDPLDGHVPQEGGYVIGVVSMTAGVAGEDRGAHACAGCPVLAGAG